MSLTQEFIMQKERFAAAFNDSLEIPSVNPRFVKEIRAFLGPFSLLLLTLSFFFTAFCIALGKNSSVRVH